MKILMICSNEFPAPPPENVIHASLHISSILAEGLVKKNHQITYVCGKNSQLKTNKIFPHSKTFFEVIKKDEWEIISDKRLMGQLIVPFEIDLHLTMIEELKRKKYDLVHLHSTPPFYGLPFSMRIKVPCVYTLHGISSIEEQKVINQFLSKNVFFISISNKQRDQFPVLKFIKTIYHGIPIEETYFSEKGGEEMVFTSRLKRVKGIEEAIKIAIKTKKKLLLSGDIRASEKDYFENTIRPLINQSNGLVKHLNFVNRSMVAYFFSKGKLFLFPIQWEEAFGLVMIESMACGTPVVAFARGSVPEVIKDGETGFIVNPSDDDIRGDWIVKKTGIEGLCEAVERIYSMPEEQYRQMRKNCRAHVEKNFTAERMVDEYEKVYQEIINNTKRH